MQSAIPLSVDSASATLPPRAVASAAHAAPGSALADPSGSVAESKRFVIEGITRGGKPFRPSDWAERLAGALSSFRPSGLGLGAHIGYSPYCVPRVVDGAKCVIVSEALREIELLAWEFVMNFARDNELSWRACAAGEGD